MISSGKLIKVFMWEDKKEEDENQERIAVNVFIDGGSNYRLHFIILNHQPPNHLLQRHFPPSPYCSNKDLIRGFSLTEVVEGGGAHLVLQPLQLARRVYEEKVRRPSSSLWTVTRLFQP